MVQADSWLSLKINKKRDIFSHFYYNKCDVKHFLNFFKIAFYLDRVLLQTKIKNKKKKVSARIAAIVT